MGQIVDLALKRYKTDFAILVKRYGRASNIPDAEDRLNAERLRAAYVYEIATEKGIKLTDALKYYSIDARVAEEILGNPLSEVSERELSRAERRKAVIAYCEANPGVQLTTDQIAELGGFSANTARSVIEDRPDLFRKISRGLYEVRDYKIERAQARLTTKE